MGRPKKPYSLSQRKGHSPYWYCSYYDINGKRRQKCTYLVKKSDATAFCNKEYQNHNLDIGSVPTLESYVKQQHWYEWDDEKGLLCFYSLCKNAHAKKERPAIQRGHIDKCRAILEQHILPTFGKCKLDRLQVEAIERWMLQLSNQGKSTKTIANIASVFRTIMKEAVRLSHIRENPFKNIEPYSSEAERKRACLHIEEAKTLMNPATIPEIWKGNMVNYLASLTSMVTGLREGEILAMQVGDLNQDHIDVQYNWKTKYRTLGPTKTKRSKAPIGIPPYLYTQLKNFCKWETGFLLSYTNGKTPATGARLADALYKAMEKIGIDDSERRERNIVFHSWRIFCNTYLRGKNISDAKIEAQIRHTSPEMTDNYTSWDPEAFKDVSKVQEELVTEVLGIQPQA